MNIARLKAYMALNGDNQEKLAGYLCRSRSRLNAKINRTNGADLTLKEMEAIATRYTLTAAEAGELFFTDEVSRTRHTNTKEDE